MRLIDADAITNRIIDELRTNGTFDELNGRQAANLIGRAIDEAPTVGGWISVKDRLPEKDGQYLVCLNQTHLMVVSFAKKLEEVDRDVFKGRDEPGWFDWDTEWCGFYEVTMVTHWMQIPKLPEEVSGDE